MTSISINGACGYCGGWHNGICSRVESIEYHEDGTVKKVTLRDPLAPLFQPQPFDPNLTVTLVQPETLWTGL